MYVYVCIFWGVSFLSGCHLCLRGQCCAAFNFCSNWNAEILRGLLWFGHIKETCEENLCLFPSLVRGEVPGLKWVLCDLNLFMLKSFERRAMLSSILYNFLLPCAYFAYLWIEYGGVILLMTSVRWQVLLCCIAECGDLATLSLRICQRLKGQVSFGVQREVQQCRRSILELIAC